MISEFKGVNLRGKWLQILSSRVVERTRDMYTMLNLKDESYNIHVLYVNYI